MSDGERPRKGWVVRVDPVIADHYIYDGDEEMAKGVHEAALALGRAMGWPRPIAWIGYVDLDDDGCPVEELPEAGEWLT